LVTEMLCRSFSPRTNIVENQPSVEADLTMLAERWVDLDDHALQHRCEQAIRNYDPCISCATHFLDLRMDRR